MQLSYRYNGKWIQAQGVGNGPINATKRALEKDYAATFHISDYAEHTIGYGSGAEAASYLQIENNNGQKIYGVGIDTNTTKATIKAMFCALHLLFG